MKKLLMLGSSFGSRAAIMCARSMGIYTIVADNLSPERSPAKREADESWLISTGDIDALEIRCRESGVSAIMNGVSGYNIRSAMELCRRLNLPYYCTREAREVSLDKYKFKNICRKVGAPIPNDYEVSCRMDKQELDRVKLPVVVKPIDQGANRGVSYCYTREELIKGCILARSVSSSDRIIVERMLHGEEWYGLYAVANGESRLLSLNAMYSQPGEPKNCYSVTTTATNNIEKFVHNVNPTIEKLLKEVGCTDGIVWVQVMLDEDGSFYLIEMGYRGDSELMYIPLRNLTSFDAVKYLVEVAIGVKHTALDLPKNQMFAFEKCACGFELFTNKGGRIVEFSGLDEIAAIPGVYLDRSRYVGDEIKPYSAIRAINEKGEDMIIKYTDFKYLKEKYREGLEGR